MIEFFKENAFPIMVGIALGLMFNTIVNVVSDTVIKIELLKNDKD